MTPRALTALLATLFSAAALPQLARADTVYYLRAGSTDQQGCFGSVLGGTCACALLPPEPLRGHFTLTPSTPDPVYQNYTLNNIRFRAPTLGQTFDGSGTYQTVTASPGQMQIQMDLAIDANPAMQWFGGRRVFAPSPIIETALSLQSDCFNIALTLVATPFRSDWNADGAIAVNDIFAFLTAWFAGDGDANESGQTTTADIFVFLSAWMSGG